MIVEFPVVMKGWHNIYKKQYLLHSKNERLYLPWKHMAPVNVTKSVSQ